MHAADGGWYPPLREHRGEATTQRGVGHHPNHHRYEGGVVGRGLMVVWVGVERVNYGRGIVERGLIAQDVRKLMRTGLM